MASPAGSGLLCTIRRYLRETRGISAVEFAFVAPIMVTLLLGGAELTQAITAKRKTTIATRAIADLIAQSTEIDNTDLANIFKAIEAVIQPFPDANFKIVVSSVGFDADGNAEIIWSEAHGGAAKHQEATLPDGLGAVPATTTLIWAEGEYSYTPIFGLVFTNALYPGGVVPLKDHIYLRPRLKPHVCRKTATETICKLQDVTG
ncbi:MAG: pilus assembly protein [Bradyrhizobiaceae bacterium]|nr:pilus assembly protein [Bradyrhizobiaceae bacterium]